MFTISFVSPSLCNKNNSRHSSYLYRRIKHNSVEIYEKLINLENWINSYLSYPNVTLVTDLNKCLEKYNQMFNVVVVKVKIKDRMYCRSVQRLLEQHGPIFLRYDYTFDFLMRYWGWTQQQVVNLRTWLTDVWYTWSLLKRFVYKYNYPIKPAYSSPVTQNSFNVTVSGERVNEDCVNVTQSGLEDAYSLE